MTPTSPVEDIQNRIHEICKEYKKALIDANLRQVDIAAAAQCSDVAVYQTVRGERTTQAALEALWKLLPTFAATYLPHPKSSTVCESANGKVNGGGK